MEEVAPQVASLVLKKVLKLFGAVVLYILLFALFVGGPLLLAPLYVDTAASLGYKTTEAVGIASFLGGGIAGAVTALIMQRR